MMTLQVMTQEQFHEALVEHGTITEDQFQSVIDSREAKEAGIGEALVVRGVISESQLGQMLAWWYKVPYFDFGKEGVDHEITNLLPESFVREQRVIPVSHRAQEGFKVATTDPQNIVLRCLLEKYLRDRVQFVFATDRQIAGHLYLFQQNLGENIKKILKQPAVSGNATDTKAVTIVDTLISFAYQTGVSDIHLESGEKITMVRFRVDGVLHDMAEIPPEIHQAVISRLKVMARLPTDETRKTQDGKILFQSPWHDAVDIRLSLVPTTHAENAVLRLLTDRNKNFSFHDIGLRERDAEKVLNASHQPWGMILVAGPTGSGKTTTLYSVLKMLNDRDIHIVTIEDPVEYDMKGVTQIQVNEKVGLTFAGGLRSIVRQDPDIIMVGEIRDRETAGIAINAAMTGHLVLSTIHTNDAATTFVRLIDMGAEDYLLASTINVVIAQRLIRRICLGCIQSVFLTPSQIQIIERIPKAKEYFLSISEKQNLSDVRLFAGKGCGACHQTGYKDRVGIFEVLVVTEKIRQGIMEGKEAETIKEIAQSEEMTTMLQDGFNKALVGLTTIEEVLHETQTAS